MKPFIHAEISAHRYGGTWTDYIDLHNKMDESKAHFASMQHRLFFHSDFGIDLAEKIFGATYHAKSIALDIPTRLLLTDHVVEDLGRVVPIAEWMSDMPMEQFRVRRPRADFIPLLEDPIAGAVERWGGVADDYRAIIEFFDSARAYALTDEKALWTLHNSFGIYVAEMVFGVTITNAAGKVVCVRTIGEDLVQARTGYIPSFGAILSRIRLTPWMRGSEVADGLARRHRESGKKIAIPVLEEDLVSTYCGSISRADLAAHMRGCEPCASDAHLASEATLV